MHEALLGDMAIDAVVRVVNVQVEAGTESGALAVVARLLEDRCLEVLEALDGCGRPLYGVAAGKAVEGIGRREKRLLLAGDEAVDECLDAMVVDRRGRRWLGYREPLGQLEHGTHARQSYA